MEKYGTYLVYKNKLTGEIKRLPLDEEPADFNKYADENTWEKLEEDPQDESTRDNKEN